mgnify:FL=1
MKSNDKRLSDLAAEADDQDLARARAAITEGVKTARDSWIPKHLVAQALVLELQACIVDEDSLAVVEFLRRMADTIEKPEKSKPNYH